MEVWREGSEERGGGGRGGMLLTPDVGGGRGGKGGGKVSVDGMGVAWDSQGREVDV